LPTLQITCASASSIYRLIRDGCSVTSLSVQGRAIPMAGVHVEELPGPNLKTVTDEVASS
jgi:hypothetical protein